jgi:hypothetical protein
MSRIGRMMMGTERKFALVKRVSELCPLASTLKGTKMF